MSILANTMTAANSAVEVYRASTGVRATLNFNVTNTGAADDTLDVYMVPVSAFGVSAVTVTAQGGSYSVIPTVSFSGGGGTGAAGTVSMELDNATLAAIGSGYAVSDVLTLTDDGAGGTAAQITVTDVDASGGIQTFGINSRGAYSALPANPVAVTGGTGTGATFDVSYRVKSVAVTEAGTGYTSAPTVTFSSGTATATTAISASLATMHKIEHAVSLSPGSVLYRTALVIGPGDALYAQSTTADLAISAWGIEALV